MQTTKKWSTKTLVLGAVLTALVFLLQMMGSFIHFGPFSVSLVLIPIVIGAATCGFEVSAYLGLIFSVAVFTSGDAAAFMAVDVFGTIVTVVLKGVLCGLCAGLVYKGVMKLFGKNMVAVLAAAIVCPIVNTGVFLLGCLVFFMDTVVAWGQAAGFGDVGQYLILGLVGANFLFEIASNIVLSPLVVRLLNIRKKQQ